MDHDKLTMEALTKNEDAILEWETKRKAKLNYINVLRLIIAEDQRIVQDAKEKLTKNPTAEEKKEFEQRIVLNSKLLILQKERLECERILYEIDKRQAERDYTETMGEQKNKLDLMVHINIYSKKLVELGKKMGFEEGG